MARSPGADFLVALLLLAACRRERPQPAEARETSPPGVAPAAALAADAAPATLGDGASTGSYQIADDEVRRATYLTRAVLILPSPAFEDVVPSLFADSSVRFVRLAEDEKFGQYDCGAVSEGEARPWVTLAARELATHSPALLRRSGTRWIAFCVGLRQGGSPRPAVPAGSGGTILFDTRQAGSEDSFVASLHHELFHMLDYADPALVGGMDWNALNESGSQYGGGGRYARYASGHLGSGNPGFVTAYAQSGIEEDKAEMFRFLVVDPVNLASLAGRDSVVAAKRDLMLRRLGPLCSDRPGAAVCRERTPG